MSNKGQKKIDLFWQKILLRWLPLWLKPNHFTLVRLILLPLAIALLWQKYFLFSAIVFILAAWCDTLDGSLARTRGLASELGGLIDPIADKALVIIFSFTLIFYYPFYWLPLTILMIDIVILISAFFLFFLFPGKKLPRADWWGKIKMLLQVSAITFTMIYLINNAAWLMLTAAGFWFAAIIFAFLSLGHYTSQVMRS